jgi:hypothetical protein
MKLQVYVKQVYGNDMIYPSCETSKTFLKALGLKTFTATAFGAAKALGATFEFVVYPTGGI